MSIKQIEDERELTGEIINYILNEKRLVFYGLSRDTDDFSHRVYNAMISDGFQVFPVNPRADHVGDIELHHPLDTVPTGYDTAYIMVNKVFVEDVILHCQEQGITRVWLHKGIGEGSVSPEALQYCSDNDIDVVPGQCILMYLEENITHRVHKWVKHVRGSLPILSN